MTRSGNRQAKVLDLIGQVYDTALDDRLWPTFAPEIAAVFDATSASVFTRNLRHGAVDLLSMTANFDSLALQSYASHYAQHDVWVARAGAIGPSKVFTSKDLVEDRTFELTEIYNDYCKPSGNIFYMVGSFVPIANDEIGVIGVHRPRALGPFEEDSKALVETFLPHLQRAMQLRRRLAEQEIAKGVTFDVLDRSATAALVVGRDTRILYANREAERLLQSGADLAAIGGRLALRRRAPADRLTALVRGAVDTAASAGTAPGGAMAIERDDHLPLTVLVAPFRPACDGLGAALPAAIVFVRDPERPTAISSLLQGLFGLTAAEASIAAMLSEGGSIDEIAARQRITRNTARVHFKSIFAKTGTSRQAQLVALILRSVAGFAAV
jgi:DNA-binding CsgD family transcriptional regulator